MNKKKLDYFKNKLLTEKEKVLNLSVIKDHDDLIVAQDDLADEADLANNTINQQISFSIREKEMAKLRRIEAALVRMAEGTYGICIESGDDIDGPEGVSKDTDGLGQLEFAALMRKIDKVDSSYRN